LIASARDYQARGDDKAAIIQLKNALQQRPQDGAARLMLGLATLRTGDPVSADKELRKALELGQAPEQVLPPLARAMLELGEAGKLLKEFGDRRLADPGAQAGFLASLGQAQLQLGRLDEAANAFKAAQAIDPELVAANLGQARLLAASGNVESALQLVDQVIARHPKAADAFVLQADLRLYQGDRAGAKASLEQAVEADGAYLPGRLALVEALIQFGEFDAAAIQLDAARKLRAGDLRILYFDSLIAYGKKDLAKAREAVLKILKASADNVPALVLAGAIDLKDGKAADAEKHLRRAVANAPQHAGARRLMVRAYLSTEQPAKALDTLQPLVASSARLDPALLMLAGETYLANGELQPASTFFAAAAETKSQEPSARTRLGQIALLRGDSDTGIRELEAATALENAPIQADISLILGYLRRKDYDRALETARQLAKKYPKNPMVQQLQGEVHLVRREPKEAREAFENALAVGPKYLPAVAGLARIDLAEKKPGDARKRFEDLIARDPKNERALLGFAEVMTRTGAPPAELLPILQRAVSVNPQSANARLALIGSYLRAKDTRAALTAAQEADAAIRNDLRILGALAQAQEAAGEPNQAIETYNRMAALDPKSSAPLTRLAALHVKRKDYSKAIETLRRAQKIAPNDPAIGRDLVGTYLLAGKAEDALKEAQAVRAATPKVGVGYLLEGDVYASTKRWPQAERAYRDGLKVDPTSDVLAVKLHVALLEMNRVADAESMARNWLAQHPKDTRFRNYLAERMTRAGNMKQAITLYEAVLAQDSNNVVALNNLAWVAGTLGDPRAIGYAERAVKLAPDSAPALDTLGVLLVRKGDAAKGIEYLGRATTLAPDRHDIRFNYAKALVNAGRGDEARKQLSMLQGVTADFPGKSEIPMLLKQI
jgi:putative PEP-CTERM system TPR-repeat lipoprotein